MQKVLNKKAHRFWYSWTGFWGNRYTLKQSNSYKDHAWVCIFMQIGLIEKSRSLKDLMRNLTTLDLVNLCIKENQRNTIFMWWSN